MKVDVIEIAGMHGIQLPAGAQIGDEFVLSLRVQLFGLEHDTIDVSGDFGQVEILRGALHAKLVALDGAAVDAVVT